MTTPLPPEVVRLLRVLVARPRPSGVVELMRRASLGHGSLLAAVEVLERQGVVTVPREPVTYKAKVLRSHERAQSWLRWKRIEVQTDRARRLLKRAA